MMPDSKNENDDEFLSIFELNGLAEILEPDLTIQDLQVGLADLCVMTSYLSSFLVDYYSAYRDNDLDSAPRMGVECIASLLSVFKEADVFISMIDEEDESDEE